jgi:hypothetical protein
MISAAILNYEELLLLAIQVCDLGSLSLGFAPLLPGAGDTPSIIDRQDVLFGRC